jgi:hypothetical protein
MLGKHPVIFLDFDGVLTARDTTPGSYLSNSGEDYGMSERCYGFLTNLIVASDAKVVITSNWRRYQPDGVWSSLEFGQFKNPLPKLLDRLGDLYAGSLPKARHVTKSQALRIWADENEIDMNKLNYVIFDDDRRECFQESEFARCFVLTNPDVGLTREDCEKAMRILDCHGCK